MYDKYAAVRTDSTPLWFELFGLGALWSRTSFAFHFKVDIGVHVRILKEWIGFTIAVIGKNADLVQSASSLNNLSQTTAHGSPSHCFHFHEREYPL